MGATDTQQNVEDATDNNGGDDDISEFLDMFNDLPPDYQDVLDSDLPDYKSLKILKMTLGQKTFIVDKNLSVVHFRNADMCKHIVMYLYRYTMDLLLYKI